MKNQQVMCLYKVSDLTLLQMTLYQKIKYFDSD